MQKLSKKGWICKTWEGELALVTMPGTVAEKFFFSVRNEAIARADQSFHRPTRLAGLRGAYRRAVELLRRNRPLRHRHQGHRGSGPTCSRAGAAIPATIRACAREAVARRNSALARCCRLPSRVIVRDWLNANHIAADRSRAHSADRQRLRPRCDAYACPRFRETLAADHWTGWSTPTAIPTTWAATQRCAAHTIAASAFHAMRHPLIEAWDEQALWLSYADQRCERFSFDDTIAAG